MKTERLLKLCQKRKQLAAERVQQLENQLARTSREANDLARGTAERLDSDEYDNRPLLLRELEIMEAQFEEVAARVDQQRGSLEDARREAARLYKQTRQIELLVERAEKSKSKEVSRREQRHLDQLARKLGPFLVALSIFSAAPPSCAGRSGGQATVSAQPAAINDEEEVTSQNCVNQPSAEEQALFEKLRERQSELNRREQQLADKERELKTLEERVDQRIKELRSIQNKLAGKQEAVVEAPMKDEEEQVTVKHVELGDVLRQMSPRAAAAVLGQMKAPEASQLLRELKAKQISKVLAKLPPESASDIIRQLRMKPKKASRRKSMQKKLPPKEEGEEQATQDLDDAEGPQPGPVTETPSAEEEQAGETNANNR